MASQKEIFKKLPESLMSFYYSVKNLLLYVSIYKEEIIKEATYLPHKDIAGFLKNVLKYCNLIRYVR
jgi:hypothetical protein